jgi:SH3-like domain-containing protein
MYNLLVCLLTIFFSFFDVALADNIKKADSLKAEVSKQEKDNKSNVDNKFEYYFVATKSDEVNVRTGPNKKYPLKWRIIRKNEPLKVVKKFEHWREVIDSSGDIGWVHVSNISSKRYVKTISGEMVNIYQEPDDKAKISFKTEGDIILLLLNCQESWCRVEKNGYKGWIHISYLWGV